MDKGLIIREKWLSKIFKGHKTWEMRSTPTNITGPIKLIKAGSGLIHGECTISGCHKVDSNLAKHSFQYHQVIDLSLLRKWCWAWRLANVQKYEDPIPYNHPVGAVIWVNLPSVLD